VGIADADILEERVMTILRRPKINTRRKNLLLVAAALVFVVPCVVAAPFAFHIGVNTQSAAVSPDDNVVSPRASVVAVQQGDRQKAKQEERTAEDQRKRLRELREEALKRRASEVEALLLEARKLHDASSMQEMEGRKKLLGGGAEDASEMQEMEGRKKLGEGAEKLQVEHEAKNPVLKLKGQYKLEPVIISSSIREPAKKANIAELAKKANITMQQAIQIAMSQQPGTVMQCRLISEQPAGERDQVFYILTIVSGDEQKSASTTMLISAVDGRVVRTWKNER
jgi:uncharacterized membrane protein YkoI